MAGGDDEITGDARGTRSSVRSLSQWRLVLAGRVGEQPHAFVYPATASKYHNASFHFEVADDQEIPRLEPGGVMQTSGSVVAGATPVFVGGGVTLSAMTPLKKGGQMLAERGNVIAHPAIVGPHPGWRYVESHSFDTVEAWSDFVSHRVRITTVALIAVVLFLLAWIALFVLVILQRRHGGGGGGAAGAGGGGFGVGLIAGLVLARRARKALRDSLALRDTPPQPSFMRLWWCVGNGHGPMAVASLSRTPDEPESFRVPVIGVTTDLVEDGPVPVEVHGLGSETPLIVAQGHTLWPADLAQHRGTTGWEPRRGRRRWRRAS